MSATREEDAYVCPSFLSRDDAVRPKAPEAPMDLDGHNQGTDVLFTGLSDDWMSFGFDDALAPFDFTSSDLVASDTPDQAQLWPLGQRQQPKSENQPLCLDEDTKRMFKLLDQKIHDLDSRLQLVEKCMNNDQMDHKLDGVLDEVRSTKGGMKELQCTIKTLVHALVDNQGGDGA